MLAAFMSLGCLILFIPSLHFVVWGNQSTNLRKPRSYVKVYTNFLIHWFVSCWCVQLAYCRVYCHMLFGTVSDPLAFTRIFMPPVKIANHMKHLPSHCIKCTSRRYWLRMLSACRLVNVRDIVQTVCAISECVYNCIEMLRSSATVLFTLWLTTTTLNSQHKYTGL